MYIIFVRNYRIKLMLVCLIALFWVAMIALSDFFIHSGLIFKVTINNYLAFSYPFEYEVADIYINQQVENNSIETTSTFGKAMRKKFLSYKSLDGKFSFDYPSAFTIKQQEFAGSEILYHISFHNKSQTAQGFVQVWNIPFSLDEFLNNSKSHSELDFKYFHSRDTNVNGMPGYSWDYAVTTKEGKTYKGSEVFLKKGENMFRISYFVPEELWNKDHEKTFWSMVKSLKTY